MPDDKDDDEPVIVIRWATFEAILEALYDFAGVLHEAVEELGEEVDELKRRSLIHLVPKPPKEEGH